jgi:hypothetical protein
MTNSKRVEVRSRTSDTPYVHCVASEVAEALITAGWFSSNDAQAVADLSELRRRICGGQAVFDLEDRLGITVKVV